MLPLEKAFANKLKKVILVETDSGLRVLDIFLDTKYVILILSIYSQKLV